MMHVRMCACIYHHRYTLQIHVLHNIDMKPSIMYMKLYLFNKLYRQTLAVLHDIGAMTAAGVLVAEPAEIKLQTELVLSIVLVLSCIVRARAYAEN